MSTPPEAALQDALEAHADEATQAWFNAYMKGVIAYRGLKLPRVRELVRAWVAARPELGADDLHAAALRLLRAPLAEDKLAGILLLQERALPAGCLDTPEALDALGACFDDGAIQDWSTCDWLCIRVLAPLIRRGGEPTAQAIAAWRHAATLWQRRAAGVAFVPLASRGDAALPGLTDLVLEVCATTVQDPARFAQTGTGWTLRELAVAEPARVLAFTEAHLAAISAEGLSYITEKTLLPERKRLRAARRTPPAA